MFLLPILLPGMLLLAGCVQTSWQSGYGPSQTLATADQMMDIEQADRIRRFQRLARLNGITPPEIDQLVVPAAFVPGATRPIPVIRVVFDERVFFDTNSATPRPEAASVLNVMAENMHHDVPDLRVTVLGHTDAVGTDAANIALSERRALSVLQILVRDGVNPGQLGTVAIGKAQPIAPNSTAAGRARNRRVEFLISASEDANLHVVEIRPINPAWLQLAGNAPVRRAAPAQVEFLKPKYTGPADFSEAPAEQRTVVLASAKTVQLQGGAPGAGDTGSPVSGAAPAPRRDAVDTGSPVAPAE
jgi:outer membrane protein OmpA-like peptidoglycan-associated protein